MILTIRVFSEGRKMEPTPEFPDDEGPQMGLHRAMARSRKRLFLFALHRSPRLGLAVLTAFLCYASSGCLSHRYTIPQQELARLAQLPPQTRGERVYVVQDIGERRDDPVEAAPPYVDHNVAVNVGIVMHPGHVGHIGRHHGAPMGNRMAPPLPRTGRSGGHSSHGGGGWHSDAGGNALAAVIVIIVAVAVLSAMGFAVTEGVRYDGAVQMYAEQPVHLKDAYGHEMVVPLSQLVPAHASQAVSAEVMDDEGWGMRMVERRPLDRKGAAFKLDMGSLQAFCRTCYTSAGFAANLQFGYFPHHRVGVLATASLGGGSNALGESFERHTVGVETQWFPLSLWRLHLGGFGHAGWQIGREEGNLSRTGIALGGGAILEIALTTRLALMARADWTTAENAPEGGWASTQIFTGGIAVY